MYMDSRIRRTDVCTWTRVNKRLHGLERQTQKEIETFLTCFCGVGGTDSLRSPRPRCLGERVSRPCHLHCHSAVKCPTTLARQKWWRIAQFLVSMPGANTSAASAALAAKRAKGKGRLGLNRIQRLERELRKKQKEETAAEAAVAAADGRCGGCACRS